MRIGILTQPLRTNYGGILQNYALQTTLKRLGHEPITLDYNTRYTPLHWLLGEIKSLITRTPHRVEFPRYYRGGQEQLNRFVHNNITTTKPYYDLPLKKFALNVDAMIVGSDQVWRPLCNVPQEWLFEMFLESIHDIKISKIAYAASFGSENWEYSAIETEKCSELIKGFRAVSVREDSGVDLCKSFLNRDAVAVLDPTMLLSGDEYKAISKTTPVYNKPTLFAYLLDSNNEKIEQIKHIARVKNLDLFIKGANDDISRKDSVERWLSWINDASYVITDSFHGAVFSILFKRPFNVYMDSWRGNARFNSLLKMIELQQRGIYQDQPIVIEESIDWSKVEEILSKKRSESVKFIQDSLMQ